MPTYSYLAKNISGKTVRGQATTPDRGRLAQQLGQDQLFLVQCREVKTASVTRRMSAKRIASFNTELGTMLSAGITLAGAMEIMLQRELSPSDRALYETIYDKLLGGMALSDAARSLGDVFPPLLISMYVSGESNGTLDDTCLKMADHYRKEFRLQAKIRSAMAYPVFLVFLLIGVMLLIFNFILPTFLDIYGDMELPALTRGIIAFSKLFTDYGYVTLIVVLALALGIKALCRIEKVRWFLDRQKLRLPIFGKLMRTIYTARFSRTLSSLYSTGITILNALEISRDTVGNAYISRQFDGVIEAVRSGSTLSDAIRKIDGYDVQLAPTIRVGEETGRLDAMLLSVADTYDYEAEQATNKMVSVVEPMMIILIAIFVGLVMVGVMMPIYNMYSAINSMG